MLPENVLRRNPELLMQIESPNDLKLLGGAPPTKRAKHLTAARDKKAQGRPFPLAAGCCTPADR